MVRELDRGVLFAADADDFAPPLERVESVAELILVLFPHSELPREVPKREDSETFFAETGEDFRVPDRHARSVSDALAETSAIRSSSVHVVEEN